MVNIAEGAAFTYYVVRVREDRYDLRQTRYRELLSQGIEHDFDLMAVHFTAEGMRELVAKHFPNTDTSSLPGSC